jgi:hypothetical protein
VSDEGDVAPRRIERLPRRDDADRPKLVPMRSEDHARERELAGGGPTEIAADDADCGLVASVAVESP